MSQSWRKLSTGTQSRHLEAGTEAESQWNEERCSWRSWLTFSCAFIPPRTNAQRSTLPTVSWILPYQPLIKKIQPQTSPQGSLMEALSKLRFPDVPSLYQVDRKLTNTDYKVRDWSFALCWVSCLYRKWNHYQESWSTVIASLVCVSLHQCGPNGLTSEPQK